jgi:serine phosphatase RsbU (regulator of sigma subunit)
LRTDTYRLAPEDRLLVCTDGLLEARDAAGDFFPLREYAGLVNTIDPETALDTLVEALARHTGGELDDDVALLLVSGGDTDLRTDRGQG